MLEEYLKKTEPEYYPPVENLLDLIYEHYTENNPVEKNTVAAEALGISRHGMCWSSGLAEKTKHTEDTDHDEQSKNLP